MLCALSTCASACDLLIQAYLQLLSATGSLTSVCVQQLCVVAVVGGKGFWTSAWRTIRPSSQPCAIVFRLCGRFLFEGKKGYPKLRALL